MTDTGTQTEDNIKELREKAEKAKQLPELQRQLAFAKAKIDYESGHGAVLFKMHEGDLTSEAILATAKTLNLDVTGSAAPVSEPVIEAAGADEQQAFDQIQGASQSNDQQSEGLGPDPWELGRQAREESRKRGEPIEWQNAAAISPVVAASNRNDPRVSGTAPTGAHLEAAAK
jgi:hypothetical protein